MSIQSAFELENTKAKLRMLEERYAKRANEPAEDPHVRQLTLQSLKKLINQLTEEIVRYESHVSYCEKHGQ